MTASKFCRQAIVIGAGMAGLAAAGAVAEYFERVIVLERGRLPDRAMPRSGGPQSWHLHGLVPGGQRALSDLFPDFERDLVDAGAVPLRVSCDMRTEVPGLGPYPSRDFGWLFYGASRPLIERVTRRQVEKLANVTVRPQCSVIEIIGTPDGSMARGVRYESTDGREEALAADLVIDASGRGAPTLALLRSSRRMVPHAIVIGVDVHYTTATFVIPPDASTDWRAIVTRPRWPEHGRGGSILPIEGNRWILTLTGRLGERPPVDLDGFMGYLQRLETQTIYNAVKHAERRGGFERYAHPASIWRRFDRLSSFPDGLVPIGDSICRYNPNDRHGMSVAAQEAWLLKQLLKDRMAEADPLAGLAPAFFSESLPLVEGPWTTSAISDLAYPATCGERPADLESQLKYNGALTRVAMQDAAVHRLVTEVQHLLKPPSVLKEPSVDRLVQDELLQTAAR